MVDLVDLVSKRDGDPKKGWGSPTALERKKNSERSGGRAIKRGGGGSMTVENQVHCE